MSFVRTLRARMGRPRPVNRALHQTEAAAELGVAVIGGVLYWWSDSWLAGLSAGVLLSLVYQLFLAARVAEWVTRGQRDYDATPDGRLTRHHG